MSAMVHQVRNYRWPSGGEQPIAGLRVPLDRLAAEAGLQLEDWEEDGLGPARGAWSRLPSGRVVQLYELDYARKDGGRLTISADLNDIGALGSRALVDEVLKAFGLSGKEVVWSQDAAMDARLEERMQRQH